MLRDNTFSKIVLNNLNDGVYFVDKQKRITHWNVGAERITGFTSAEVIGLHCGEHLLMHISEDGTNLCNAGCPLAKALAEGKELEEEMYLQHKDGHRVPVLVRVAPIRNDTGEVIGAVQIFKDNSSKLAVLSRIEELKKMIFLDLLTGIANRQFIEKDIQAKLDEMERYGWPFGILFMDIDHFKKINEEYGMDVGDKVLMMVAKTLSGAMRSFDNVGRWGDEEFVAIITNISLDKIGLTANRLRLLVERSGFKLDPQRIIRVTVSIGATVAEPGDSVYSLVSRAEEMMLQSKTKGRDQVTVG